GWPSPLGVAQILDDAADQLVDKLGPKAPGELAHRRLVRHWRREWDQAEAAQVQGVGDLADQALIAPAHALLDQHQAQVGVHCDGGSADDAEWALQLRCLPVPVSLERGKQASSLSI